MRRHVLDTPISYYALFLSTRYLPKSFCHWMGKIFVSIVYPFLKKDQAGLAYNLSLALDRPAEDPFIKKTIRRIFFNYTEYMADFFMMPQLPPHKVRKFFSHLKGEEILTKALNRGKGAILLSAHVGNWEFGGTMVRLANYPLAVVAIPHNTPATNSLVNKLRKDKGIKVFEMSTSPFSGIEVLHHLRDNGVVAMIGDKDFLGHGWPITFFGKEIAFPVGPVVMAMKSGAALIPAFVLKQPDGRYFGVIEKEISLELEGDRDETIKINLSKTARVFEKYIRKYPDQWYCPDPIDGTVL